MRKSEYHHLYGYRWQQARRIHLMNNPLCVYCTGQGIVTPAKVVDHIRPHRGDIVLFWDRNNWQSLCGTCHDDVKKNEETKGYSNAIGLDGWPMDIMHPVNQIGMENELYMQGGVSGKSKRKVT